MEDHDLHALLGADDIYVFCFGQKLETFVRLIYFVYILWYMKRFGLSVKNYYSLMH